MMIMTMTMMMNLNMCITLSNYRSSFARNFHLERYITSITKCILLMYAHWCFLEKVNLHFTG
jgi:hypothetical protein